MSVTGGCDSGCGGATVTIYTPSVQVLRCERCGDDYPERCGCRKKPCPRCGLDVFFAGDIAQAHLCIPSGARSVTPAILFQQFQREAIDQFAAHFIEIGRQLEREGK